MKSIPFLLLAGFLILPNSVSLAQAPQQPQRVPDGGTREVLISILIPSLPNAPFTATVNTEWIRQLPDGSTITLKNRRAIARDAAGRIFQERRALVPDDGKAQSGVTQIEISDPVAHELYICMPHGSTCQLEVFSPPESFPYTPPAKAHVAQGSTSESEDLGKQAVGGLETVGTRETTITYRLDPIASGTRVTVRDEGFLGRSEAAYGNAEHWERVLGWLDAYMRPESASAAG